MCAQLKVENDGVPVNKTVTIGKGAKIVVSQASSLEGDQGGVFICAGSAVVRRSNQVPVCHHWTQRIDKSIPSNEETAITMTNERCASNAVLSYRNLFSILTQRQACQIPDIRENCPPLVSSPTASFLPGHSRRDIR